MISPAMIIEKKRDGHELTREEIQAFIRGVGTGEIADYQATAFLMAVFFRGMSFSETAALTEAMLQSGERYDLSRIPGPKVDKHSTGGVGDKVSLILAPLAAACGLKVPMMSGRGLGHSGGTLDKLESISGFNVRLSHADFEKVLAKVGCAMIGQSEKIAPADKKLYALRDVTATVECIPLIVASILSKKLAEGTEGLVLDVKCGSGAFMKTQADARALAKTLIQVGKKMGLKIRALLTNMDQPLGYAAGNALEMRESIEVLRNIENPELSSEDLRSLTIELCAHMLELGGVVKSVAQGRKLAESKLRDGSAWTAFENLVQAQGGSLDQVRDPSSLPKAPYSGLWLAEKTGRIARMDTAALGRIVVELGGGRKKASDVVDPAVGLVFHRKVGDAVKAGDTLVTVHASRRDQVTELEKIFQDSVKILGKASGRQKKVPKLILEQY